MSWPRTFLQLIMYLSMGGCTYLMVMWALPRGFDWLVAFLITLVEILIVERVIPMIPKGLVTRFFTFIHDDHGEYVACMIAAAAHACLMEGRWERPELCFGFFMVAMLCFLLQHASEEVLNEVCKILSYHISGYFVFHLFKEKPDLPEAVVCGLTCCICRLIMVYGLRELPVVLPPSSGRTLEAMDQISKGP